MSFELSRNYDNKKKVIYNLQKTYGIGKGKSILLCKECNINPYIKWENLTTNMINHIIFYIRKNIKVEKELKKSIFHNIDFLKKINNYRGYRHSLSLPVRGQRTHSNARSFKLIKGQIHPKKIKRK